MFVALLYETMCEQIVTWCEKKRPSPFLLVVYTGMWTIFLNLFNAAGPWVSLRKTLIGFSAKVQKMWLYAHARGPHLSPSLHSTNREQQLEQTLV